MQRLRKLFFVTLATLALGFAFSSSQAAFAQGSPDLVISQIYGGAGCTTGGCSTYKNDFIEIYNRGTTAVSLNGLSVQYSAAGGTTIANAAGSITPLTNFMLQPGQYYLVAESFNANGVNALPAPNTTGTIAMSATTGKVFLANSTAPVTLSATTGCPTTPSQVRDFVGYGTTANCFEGAGRAPAPSTTTADIRNGGGSVDTDNNNTDFTAATPTPRNSLFGTQLLISEFRTFGPTGSCDEFIEIYNPSSNIFTVQSLETGSTGFAVAVSSGTTVQFTIPNGTNIPARGHYLAINRGCGGGEGDPPFHSFSGGGYPAGNGTIGLGDNELFDDISTNAGIAIFNTSNQANFSLATRLDAVGPSTLPADSLYKEGTGYPPINANTNNYSIYRDLRSGLPKDTQDNDADFDAVNIDAATLCESTANFSCQRLGAPGPENLSSPVQRNANIKASLIDPNCTGMAVNPTLPSACRFERRTATGGSPSSLGTLSIRRRFTNTTGATVTRLRFRIVDITTTPEGGANGLADLRAISSTTVTAYCQSESGIFHTCSDNPTPTTEIVGTTLETDGGEAQGGQGQPNGGAFNSSLTLPNQLADGAGINLQFTLGVEANGFFRFFVNVEALTGTPALTSANTKAQATGKARASKLKK